MCPVYNQRARKPESNYLFGIELTLFGPDSYFVEKKLKTAV